MDISGKLDVTLKITQLPQAKPSSPQTVLFAVQANGQTVVVELKKRRGIRSRPPPRTILNGARRSPEKWAMRLQAGSGWTIRVFKSSRRKPSLKPQRRANRKRRSRPQ